MTHLKSEFERYIDPPPQRKDLPEHPLTKLFKAWAFQIRKREVIVIEKDNADPEDD